MKHYYKTRLFGAGHPQLKDVFSTNFSQKKVESEFWREHETTHAEFTRFLKKEIKGDLLEFLKTELYVSSKKDVIKELNRLCPYNDNDINYCYVD